MREAEFIEAFETCTLPQFHHADHVRLAWLYLRDKSVAAALDAFCSGLQRFAAANGKPALYHETITWAYLF